MGSRQPIVFETDSGVGLVSHLTIGGSGKCLRSQVQVVGDGTCRRSATHLRDGRGGGFHRRCSLATHTRSCFPHPDIRSMSVAASTIPVRTSKGDVMGRRNQRSDGGDASAVFDPRARS
jgi:hypothetical protein